MYAALWLPCYRHRCILVVAYTLITVHRYGRTKAGPTILRILYALYAPHTKVCCTVYAVVVALCEGHSLAKAGPNPLAATALQQCPNGKLTLSEEQCTV